MAIITGTPGADTITDTFNSGAGGLATAGDDEIYGGPGGNDSLAGGGGADTIQSSPGASTLDGGAGNDSLLGITGAQILIGGTGNDLLDGGAGADTLMPGSGADSVVGGTESDLLAYLGAGGATVNLNTGFATDNSGGNDTLSGIENVSGADGADSVIGSSGANLILGNLGNDTLRGGAGADTVQGGADNDNIAGNSGNDSLDGGAGNDTLSYGSTTTTDAATIQGALVDLLAGTATDNWGNADSIAGFESVSGSGSADTLRGSNGADSLFGDIGNDTIFGRDGNDRLFGGTGNDTMEGGAGDDFLRPFDGNDRVIGGTGFDTASYNGDTGPITASIAAGTDGQNATVTSALGTDTLDGIDAIEGTSGADSITVTSLDAATGIQLRGMSGADTMTGTADRSTAVLADYRVFGVAQGAQIDLATGIVADDGFGFQDRLIDIVVVRGTDFADTILGSDFNERFRGRGGNDSMDGRGGNFDDIDYSQSPNGISLNFATGIVQDGESGADTIANFEEVRATIGNDTLIGGAGNDVFRPFGGADSVDGGGGQDRLTYIIQSTGLVTPGAFGVAVNLITGAVQDAWGDADTVSGIERVTGTTFGDSILGGAESNRFNGRAGDDTLNGGLGGDYAEYGNATAGANVNLTTGVAQDGEGGTDQLISLENVIGSGFADTLTGVAQLGRSPSDLRGGAGNDLLIGIAGEYVRADYADQTTGLLVNLGAGTVTDHTGGVDTLVNIRGVQTFGDFADTFIGTAEDEWFSPSEGDDSVDGGGGFDIIGYGGANGGGVNVNLATQRATDLEGGADTLAGIEAAVLSFGNDTVLGDAGNNLIAPGAGADSVNGGGGQDTVSYAHGFSPDGIQYTANDAGDRAPVQGVLLDLQAGTATDFGGFADTILGFEHAIGGTAGDTLRGSSIGNRMEGAEGNDLIEGRVGNDTLYGDDGSDTLDGGDGVDQLYGGAGNDRYVVGTGDKTIESAGAGADTVLASVTWVLAPTIEALVLTGADSIDGSGNNFDNLIVGNGAANRLVSFAGNDSIQGNGGDDYLDGGTGADTMAGGLGNDFYKVDSVADLATESGVGNDTVLATVNWTLGADFETLRFSGGVGLIGTGNALDNNLIGNNGANRLFGLGGADTLNGANNADTLEGGDGNDTYNITAGADVVVEAPGGGVDLVRSSITHTLAAEVENLNLIGTAAINGNGNDLANLINGNTLANRLRGLDGADTLNGLLGADTVEGGDGNDRLTGGDGDDVLNGGAGNDTQFGGAGTDIFRYDLAAHGSDAIGDFTPGADLFHIRRAGFGNVLPLGGLPGANFASNAPTAAVAQFVYNGATGVLTYDLDGTGAGAAVAIATLTTKPAIAAGDFVVIA